MADAETYDVVIIGSGLGSLLCGVILSKEGKKVCILERGQQIGGCLQTFSIQKTVFDSCVHYIGGLGEGHTLYQIFKYAGILHRLKLRALDHNGFDRICFGEDTISYPHATGPENFIEQLAAYFPNEGRALKEYIRLIRYVGDQFPLYRLRKGSSDEKLAVAGWGLTETLGKITDNTLLRQVLAGNNLLYAGVRNKSPFYLHALVSESYIHSAQKVVPGSSQIAKFLWRELQANGGVIYRNTSIVKLQEEEGIIRYAEDLYGNRFYGREFIAGIHPEALLKITDSKLFRPVYRNRIEGLKQTSSSFMLNLVLQPGSVPMRNHNIYWHKEQDVWAAVDGTSKEWPKGYALYFNESKDWPGYAESLSVLCYMDFDEVKAWEGTENRAGKEDKRGDAYEAFKAARSEQLLKQVYQRVPELRGNIKGSSAATPLTYRDYTGSVRGGLYGILKDVNKPAETTIATRTKIPNLLLTGQNVNLHGVLGVSITAIATCAELLGMDYLLGKINNQ